MNIIGEYAIEYNIYTMFNNYNVKIKNHNLITNEGFDFFLSKWYKSEDYSKYQIIFGYLSYDKKNFYSDELEEIPLKVDDEYNKSMLYIDKKSSRHYRYNGEYFTNFTEKIEKVCIGKCDYKAIPNPNDTQLLTASEDYKEFLLDDITSDGAKLVMKYELESNVLDKTTEIGIKTNHGRLLSHDIHVPYNLPFDGVITLEYIFKLQ